MDPEEEALLAAWGSDDNESEAPASPPEEAASEPLPGYERRRARRTVLPTVEIEGTPEGTGTARMGPMSEARVEQGRDFDYKLPGRDPLEGSSPFWDAVLSPLGGTGERARTGERLSRYWQGLTREAARDPLASAHSGAMGAGRVTTLGGLDELSGLFSRLPNLDPTSALFPQSASADEMRERSQRAQERAPASYGTGETLGGLGLALAMPSAPTSSAMGRVAYGAAEGGAIGGATGALESDDPSLMNRLQDAATPALYGAGVGAAGAAIGEVPQLARRGARAIGEGRDEALLSATTSTGRGPTAIRAFERGTDPAALERSRAQAAAVLREENIVPRVGTTRQVATRARDAIRRHTDVMSQIRDAMDGDGVTGVEMARRLRDAAARDRTAAGAQYRDVINDYADRIAEQYGNSPIDYDRLIGSPDVPGEIPRLRQMGAYRTRAGRDIGMGEEGMREIVQTMRDAYDDAVEAGLGAEQRASYQSARRHYAPLVEAYGQAVEGTRVSGGNRGTGLSEMLWGLGGGGMASQLLTGSEHAGVGTGAATLGSMMAARGYRAIEPRLRATASEAMYRLARVDPGRLGRFAGVLGDAARQGSEIFNARLYVLAQQDAEARALLEQFSEMNDEDETPEAIRAIGESGAMQ